MSLKTKLLTYLNLEKLKPMKTRLISNQVMDNFERLVSTNKGKNQDLLRSEAVKSYEEAVKTNKRMSRFSLQWQGKTLKGNRNKETYEKHIKNELEEFKGIDLIKRNERKKGMSKTSIEKSITEMSSRYDINMAVNEAYDAFITDIDEFKMTSSQFKMTAACLMRLYIPDTNESDNVWLNVYQAVKVQTFQDIENLKMNFKQTMITEYENVLVRGSGWSFKKAIRFVSEKYNIEKTKGGEYIATPDKLCNSKKGVINIRNDDDECFKWCMKYHQTARQKNDDRISRLRKVNDVFNYEGMKFPVSFDDIAIFEKNNNKRISVFEWDDEKNEVELVRRSNGAAGENIFLLLISDGEKQHYTYLKSLGLLRASEQHSKITCEKCFESFTEKQMQYHQCGVAGEEGYKTIINYPAAEEVEEYKKKKNKNTLIQPFYCCCDFECSQRETTDKQRVLQHVPNSYSVNTICNIEGQEQHNKFKLCRGENACEYLLRYLEDEQKRTKKIYDNLRKKYEKPNLTPEEEEDFKKQTKCYVCDEEFTPENHACRDHDHLTGKYRGAACNECNLSLKEDDYKLVVVFHNLRGYDGHFIIQNISKRAKTQVRVIAQSFEKYMSFEYNNIKFIDSFMFMSSSIEKLTESLKTDGKLNDNFKFTKQHFGEHAELMCRKGVYPYSYVQNHDVFEKGLPPKEAFYNDLTKSHIKQEEYEHAVNVYKTMGCKNFGDYHDLYLKSDVLLLSDIFENFRKISFESYKLEPLKYLTCPSMSWDAMLKMTKVKLGLIHNEEERLFFESSKRGGIVQAGGKRHVTANNKYMKDYDPSKPSSYIIYLDANNLYGKAMSAYLPYKLNGFVEGITLEQILATPTESEIGYFVEVDIRIPKSLHNKFKEYPLCPVTRSVSVNELSDYQYNLGGCHKGKKLILDLYDKEKYVCHYEYLKTIVALGYKVKKVRRVVEFKQSHWLKNYIDLNTNLRKKAAKIQNEFFKDFFKLMNNAIYGKSNENILGRTKIEIVKDEKIAKKKIAYDWFKAAHFQDDMFFIQSNEKKVLYNKPSYIGNAILDISKITMINFHYGFMKAKYGDKATLVYTDTDSLVYHVECEDLYQDMYDNKNHFDLSEVKIKQFNDETNAKALGKMKDETNMIPISEWIALGPKSYSFIYNGKNKKVTKGVQKSVLKDEVTHKDFEKTLKTGEILQKENAGLRSFKHQVYTFKCMKDCLNSFDSKLYRIDYNNGHPFGYNP